MLQRATELSYANKGKNSQSKIKQNFSCAFPARWKELYFHLTILTGKNSVQEFIKVKSWLLLIFSVCLHNQLKFNYKVLKLN